MRYPGPVVLACAMLTLISFHATADEPAIESVSPPVDIHSLPVLRPGDVVTGEIEASDPQIKSPGAQSALQGKSFRIEIPETGAYTIDLRSYLFDSYLVLRDATGQVIAEDDDGLIATHARLFVPTLEERGSYSVDVCALHGGAGAFEVNLRKGKPKPLSPEARRTADLVEARKCARITEAERGADHPDTASSINKLAGLLQAQGDYHAAGPLYERALAIYERALGPDHPDTAVGLNNLAGLLKEQGDYQAAQPLYERALAISEKKFGPEHPFTATGLNNLAVLLYSQGDYQAARSLLERTLAIREKALGENHPHTVQSLTSLAALLQKQGDYQAARPLFERALPISEKKFGPEHPFTAASINNLAILLYEQGDYQAARPLLARALTIREKTLGENHPHTAQSLSSLAALLKKQGDYQAARPLYERALPISERKFGPEHPFTAANISNLAGLLYSQGDYQAARPLLERALAIREKTLGPEHPGTAAGLINLARLFRAQGNYQAARPLLERAITIQEKALGPEHPFTAAVLNDLALILYSQGEYQAARSLFERALAIRENALGENHLDTAQSLNSLAALVRAQGDYQAARPLFERALAAYEEAVGENHPGTASGLNNLAVLLLDLNERDKAFALSKRAIASQEIHRNRLAWSLTQAERLLLARTQWRKLRTLLSIYNGEAAGPEIVREMYETLLSWKAQVFRGMSQSRGGMLASLDEQDRARVERLRQLQGRLSREMFKQDIKDLDAHQGLLASLREKRKTLELELTRSLGPADDSRAASVAELRAALPDHSVLVDFFIHEIYVAASWDESGELITRGRWTPARLSAWILVPGRDEVLHVDLGEASLIEAATREHLDEMVASRGVKLASIPAGARRTSQANDDLLRLLWTPLSKYIGDAGQVFVSPDGFLGTLPLETLQRANQTYLLEHHSFVYLESAASIIDIQSRYTRSATAANGDATQGADEDRTPDPDLLCVGDVDYRKRSDLAWQSMPSKPDPDTLAGDDAAIAAVASSTTPDPSINLLAQADVRGGFLNSWESLPATDEESRAISEIHEDCFEHANRLTLRGRDATEERLKHELPRHDVVHLATHGFFQPEGLPSMWKQTLSADGEVRMEMFEEEARLVGLLPGLLSGLVLAGANRVPAADRDDGLLTAEEISLLDLSRVDLVVLSACETALGKSEAGEGMLGLRRMFRQAGANTVISSLWSVKDDSTSLLMRRFYDRRWNLGQGTLEALRGAQLDMLKKNRIENDGRGLPSTWGAFVLDGAW